MSTYSLYNDTELIFLVKEDNKAAYTELYNRYERLLLLHAVRRLRNTEEARDILHDFFVSLWEKRKELNITTSVRAYFYTSVRNRILDHISRKKNKSIYIASLKSFSENTEISTDFVIRHNQLLAMINKEIEALPPRMREIFKLSRREKLSHKQIADELNIAEGTVKNQIKSALKILKAKLGPLFFLFF